MTPPPTSSAGRPFPQILAWWEPIAHPVRGLIATHIVGELKLARLKRSPPRILRDSLAQQLPLADEANIGLRIAAAIDGFFASRDDEEDLNGFLESVETTQDPSFKVFANFAIRGHLIAKPIIQQAQAAWTPLRMTTLSDKALIAMIPGYTPAPEEPSKHPLEGLARLLACAWLCHHLGYRSLDHCYKTYVKNKPLGSFWLELAETVSANFDKEDPTAQS